MYDAGPLKPVRPLQTFYFVAHPSLAMQADEKLEKRIQAECEVRQELKRMASANGIDGPTLWHLATGTSQSPEAAIITATGGLGWHVCFELPGKGGLCPTKPLMRVGGSGHRRVWY
eukprot:5555982-Amphidinium_carterae.1